PPHLPRGIMISKLQGMVFFLVLKALAFATSWLKDLKIQEEAKRPPIAPVRKIAFMIKGGVEAPIHSHPLPPIRRVVMDHEIKQSGLWPDQFIAFTSDLRPQRDEMLFIMTLSDGEILRAGQYRAGIGAGKGD